VAAVRDSRLALAPLLTKVSPHRLHVVATGAGGTFSRAVKGLRAYFLSIPIFKSLSIFSKKISQRLFGLGNQEEIICQL